MRKFRVVSVLEAADFNRCFSVHGALRRPHKGEIHRSLRAARANASMWEAAGWYAFVMRHTPQGWVLVA